MIEIRQTETFHKWLSKLRDRNAKMKILARIRRISLGNLGDVKTVGKNVSEIRINFGPGYRIYFTKKGKEIILLLVGGDKSSQPRDIKKAQEMAAILLEKE